MKKLTKKFSIGGRQVGTKSQRHLCLDGMRQRSQWTSKANC